MFKKVVPFLGALLIPLSAGTAAAAPGDILQVLDPPGPYPSGLTYDGTNLWVTNQRTAYDPSGYPNTDHLAKVDTETGQVVMSLETPFRYFHGLAWTGTHVWGDEGYDTIRMLDPDSGVELGTIPTAGRAYGLTYDPQAQVLLQWDYESERIHRINPETGEVLSSFTPENPATSSGDLAWDGCYVWQIDDYLIRMDPYTGATLGSLLAPGPHGEGLAFDGTDLWVSDTDEDRLYRIEPLRNWPAGFWGDDKDADLVPDRCDNCEKVPNEDQLDTDADGIGDACEETQDPGDPDPPDDPTDPDPGDPANPGNGSEIGCACVLSPTRSPAPGVAWALGAILAGAMLWRRQRIQTDEVQNGRG